MIKRVTEFELLIREATSCFTLPIKSAEKRFHIWVWEFFTYSGIKFGGFRHEKCIFIHRSNVIFTFTDTFRSSNLNKTRFDLILWKGHHSFLFLLSHILPTVITILIAEQTVRLQQDIVTVLKTSWTYDFTISNKIDSPFHQTELNSCWSFQYHKRDEESSRTWHYGLSRPFRWCTRCMRASGQAAQIRRS